MELFEAPTPILLKMAQRLGIDPTQFQGRAELRDAIDAHTADIRSVLANKQARQKNREFNNESAQQAQLSKLQQAAGANRQYFMNNFGGSK